jgi:phage terminase large subunit-like protein
MQQLADDGLNIVKHAQTLMAMNFPCRAFEELILERRLRHGNDPVLRWMVSNAAILKDGAENIKIVKDKSGDRVDGVVAAVMAIGRLLIAPEPAKSVYQSRGIVVL